MASKILALFLATLIFWERNLSAESVLKEYYRKEENIILKAKLDEESHKSRINAINLALFTICLLVSSLITDQIKQFGLTFVHESYICLVFGALIGVGFKASSNIDLIKTSPSITINENGNSNSQDSLNLHLLLYRSDDEESRIYVYEYTGVLNEVETASKVITFKPTAFFSFILPPILYATGLRIRGKEFFDYLVPIILFAFVGSILSIIFTSFFIYLSKPLITISLNNFTFKHALAYSIFVSCTDPITVLAILQTMNVENLLYYILFGESALNDAVCLVADGILKDILVVSNYSEYILYFCLQFFIKFIGSTLIGLLFGLISSFVLKRLEIVGKVYLELTIFILIAYTSFLVSNSFNMIAIVSLMFCAIVQSRYSIKNLSDVAKDSLENSLEMLKYIMENIVFLQIGLILVSSQSLQWNGVFIFVSLISMFLARVASVYILSILLSSVSSIKIGKKYKIIIIVAGLRGGISYALAMNYYDSREQRAVLTATIVSIIAPIIICGFPLPFLMTKLGIQSKGNDLPVDETVDNPLLPNNVIKNNFWRKFEEKYILPFFVRQTPTDYQLLLNDINDIGIERQFIG